ncbi:unnamed protein product [Anisakis simplex]|uniref:Lyase_1 domain-containing protein n=1 Tax=Anisakis simplex TaxID=6269 RepID=A0A0M3K7A4_ANISI|nr:unnamed protein product [Anisakis simplex]
MFTRREGVGVSVARAGLLIKADLPYSFGHQNHSLLNMVDRLQGISSTLTQKLWLTIVNVTTLRSTFITEQTGGFRTAKC